LVLAGRVRQKPIEHQGDHRPILPGAGLFAAGAGERPLRHGPAGPTRALRIVYQQLLLHLLVGAIDLGPGDAQQVRPVRRWNLFDRTFAGQQRIEFHRECPDRVRRIRVACALQRILHDHPCDSAPCVDGPHDPVGDLFLELAIGEALFESVRKLLFDLADRGIDEARLPDQLQHNLVGHRLLQVLADDCVRDRGCNVFDNASLHVVEDPLI
jgi:hypothetical protein